ncbi:MAG: hypothetical protein ABL955_07650 [Elusimicrobiota bacterium]
MKTSALAIILAVLAGAPAGAAIVAASVEKPASREALDLAAGRCPDRMVWVCHPTCAEENPQTGKCMVWVPVCGCE